MDEQVRHIRLAVPADVADRLEQDPEVGALIVADAVRARIRLEALQQLEAAHPHRPANVTAEGIARARARRAQVEAEWPPERRAALREYVHATATAMFATPKAAPAAPNGSTSAA
jgi:hypothetical protein